MEQLTRRQQILQALAGMLEQSADTRITTKRLAQQVGVSEAALYRHFPSKTRMFEGLIDFASEAISSRINTICATDSDSLQQLERILTLVLLFAERNPGIARLLTGGALDGEHPRLHRQIAQFFDRIEAQLKQIMRTAEPKEQRRTQTTVTATAELLIATVQGLTLQFVRSEFKRLPSAHWQQHWQQLQRCIYR